MGQVVEDHPERGIALGQHRHVAQVPGQHRDHVERNAPLLETWEERLRGDLDRQKSLYNTILDQLKQAQLVSDYSSVSCQVVDPPSASPYPVQPRVKMTLAMGLRQNLGLFQAPVTRELGIAISDFALAISIQQVAWGVAQPFTGARTSATSAAVTSLRASSRGRRWWRSTRAEASVNSAE